MGQVLIISDSHFLRKKELQKFISQFHHLEGIVHCGDIYLGYEIDDIDKMYICRGNNDFADLPRIHHFQIGDLTFTTTHGNLNNFAYYPESLQTLLDDYPADIICFGHSHVPYLYQNQDITIVNPGSLTLSRTYPRINTYALLDTKTKKIQFYNVQTNEEVDIKNEAK